MNTSEYIKVLNTNEIIKNEFYICFFKPDFSIDKINNRIIYKDKIYNIFETLRKITPSFIQDLREAVDFQKESLLQEYQIYYAPHFIVTSYANFFTELQLEEYRINNFNNYPCRLYSQYAFNDIEELKKTVKLYNWKPIKIFKLKIDTTKLFLISKHNMEWISSIRQGYFSEYHLSSYWTGKLTSIGYSINNNQSIYEPIIEFLIDGFLIPIEELKF